MTTAIKGKLINFEKQLSTIIGDMAYYLNPKKISIKFVTKLLYKIPTK